MNVIKNGPDLGRVVMPLVRVLAQCELSWSDREKFSEAIQRSLDHWRSMEDERHMFEQNAAARQCSQGSSTTERI